MPLKTFLNLSKERQKEILDICLKEFSLLDYKDVSLTEIIKKLGLAKGSFYRYFESKRDLYEYLIDYAKHVNISLFEKTFKKPVEDILEAWARFYLEAIRFDNANPLFGGFGYKVSQDRDNIILGNVALTSKKLGIKVLKELFHDLQKKGEIRTDIDVDLMIYTLIQVQEGILDYMAIKYKIDFKENIKKGKPPFPIPEKSLKKDLEGFVKILREGMEDKIYKTPSKKEK